MSRTPTQRGTYSRRDALKLFGGTMALPLLDRLGLPAWTEGRTCFLISVVRFLLWHAAWRYNPVSLVNEGVLL